jgi:NTP pyrophosphatase (non-canonical NTP hydrolase)
MPDLEGHGQLTVQEYQAKAVSADQLRGDDLAIPLLGLFGETGSLLSEAKKKHRDAVSYTGYECTVIEELGDVLWYLTAVARRGGLSLADLAHNRDSNFADWRTDDALPFPFAALQPQDLRIQEEPSPAYETNLLKLAGEVGLLTTDYQENRLDNNRPALAGRLIAIFRTLINAANEAGVTLEEAAEANLAKIFDRWPQERTYPPLFDEDFPEYEHLPRSLRIEVFERDVGNKHYVFQRCNGINMGDRLTDNIMTPDDYRFHDVFHYAYAAVLGWSPVMRALFKLKRKSQPKVDEAEDGARATLIEEGIATWIFGQAKKLDFFAGRKANDLSLTLLKTVRQFVSGYEPERCPLWLWEEAILQGYEAFRYLKEKRRALLDIDMHRRVLAVSEMPT